MHTEYINWITLEMRWNTNTWNNKQWYRDTEGNTVQGIPYAEEHVDNPNGNWIKYQIPGNVQHGKIDVEVNHSGLIVHHLAVRNYIGHIKQIALTTEQLESREEMLLIELMRRKFSQV